MQDLIVVGGGIIGLSCAWRLAQKGLSVTVFDARELASEASWAGAGMLAPGGECFADSPLTRMALASLSQYAAFVGELTDATGVTIDYRQSGALEYAFSDEEANELNRRAEAQAELGIRSEAAAPGRFYPDDAVVNPRDVNSALKIACAALGVTFHEHEPVREILASGVRTDRGSYSSADVLLAAGAWSSALCPTLPPITPVRGHLIAYEGTGLHLDSILRHRNTYLLQRRDGAIVAGTTKEHVGFDRTLDESAISDIQNRAEQLLPGLAGLSPAARWNGFRPAIAGDVPVIGRRAATGHYRNGILLAPETARIVSSLFP